MLMNSVITSLMRVKNFINVWLTQQFDSGVHASTRLCVCSWWTLWTYSVTEINLVIYFQWLVPCLLLNCSIELVCKSYVEQQLLCCSFQSPAFYMVETTILRCGGLYCYCLVYKVFLHICWKFDENTCTITQIMTNNVRFLFSRSQCIMPHYRAGA